MKVEFKTNEISGEKLTQSALELVQIFFDTATFDDIERDKKIKMEAQLSLIGGTMGLLTGFSIISGIEIIFFLFRLSVHQLHNFLHWSLTELHSPQVGHLFQGQKG